MTAQELHKVRDEALLRGDMETVRRVDMIWAKQAVEKEKQMEKKDNRDERLQVAAVVTMGLAPVAAAGGWSTHDLARRALEVADALIEQVDRE
jgi:hypothetical protein